MQTNEEATVYVYDLDLFVTEQIIEGTLCSLVASVQRNTSRTPCLHACRDSISPHDFVHLHSHSCHASHNAWLKRKEFHLHGKSHPLMRATQTTPSQSLSFSLLLLSSSSPSPGLPCDHLFKACEDPRQGGGFPNLHTSTGFEPKKIELDKNLWSTRKIR